MKKLVLIPLVLLMAGGVAMAADMSVSAAAPTGARSTGFIAGPQSITHSLDTATITQFNSVSCNAGGLHTDNAYLRRFTLGDFGIVTQFDLTSVDIGIEQAFGAGGSQPSSVNVYTIANGAALTYANMNLVASTPITVSDASLTVVNFPVTGSVVNPATDDLVVELFTPDGQTTGNSLFVGSNPNGQTGPTYLAAADCGITDPLDTGSLGFPDMHWVLVVNGDDDTGGCNLNFAPFKVNRTANGVLVNYSMTLDHNRGAVQKSAYIELQDMTGNVVASKRAGILDLEEGARVRIKGNLRAPADLASGDYVFVLRLDGMKGFNDRRSPIFIP